MTSRVADNHALYELQDVQQGTGDGGPHNTVEDSTTPTQPDGTAEWRPTRQYQTMLLAAGFMMIFHVIGINSIYGIFQVLSAINTFRICSTSD